MYFSFIIVHVICCIFMIAIVLLQAGKGGLSGAFGTGGGGDTVFGPRTSDILTKGTWAVAVLFMVTSISLVLLSAKRFSSVVKKTTTKEQQAKSQVMQGLLKQLGDKAKALSSIKVERKDGSVAGVADASKPVVKTVEYEYDKFGRATTKERIIGDDVAVTKEVVDPSVLPSEVKTAPLVAEAVSPDSEAMDVPTRQSSTPVGTKVDPQ